MATPEPRPQRVEISISPRTVAGVLGTIAFVWAFVAARQAVLWIFIALFLAIVLATPVGWLENRRGMKRGNAAILVVLGLFLLLALLAYLLVSPFVGAVRDLIEDLPTIVERIRASELFQDLDRRTNLGEELQARAELLAADLPSKLGDAFEVGGRIFGFGLGALSIAFMTGTVQGTAAWLLGVPFALALGIVAGLLGLIPQVGATIAAVILSLVALTQGIPQALIMLAVCIAYQQLENYVLQPTIQGRAADISGFFVIASVIVGAALLGVVGALIAVPLVASAQIVIRELTAERRAAVALAHAATPAPGGAPGPDG